MPKKKKKKFYAVAVGRKVGIYPTWNDCEPQVKGFQGARFKGFATRTEAEAFIRENSSKSSVVARAVASSNPSTEKTAIRKRPSSDETIKEAEQQSQKRQKQSILPSISVDDVTSTTKIWFHINFDGGARGNPGLAGAGAEVIVRTQRPAAKKKGSSSAGTAVIHRSKTQIRKYLGASGFTNNQAEYEGAISGLEYALKTMLNMNGMYESRQTETQNTRHVVLVLQGDSNLIIQQMKGTYDCKSSNLKPMYIKAKKIISNIQELSGAFEVTYEHVYRRDNSVADGLANQAMDAKDSWITTFDGSDADSFPPPPVAP